MPKAAPARLSPKRMQVDEIVEPWGLLQVAPRALFGSPAISVRPVGVAPPISRWGLLLSGSRDEYVESRADRYQR